MGRLRLIRLRLHLIAMLTLFSLVSAPPAMANGGTIRVSGQAAGPYELTVTTSPTPLRTGVADVSVMVQKAGSSDLVQDATVVVSAAQPGKQGASLPATHEQATNKLFYAANVSLPAEGRWTIGVHVSGSAGEGATSFDVEVAEAGPLDNPTMVLLLAAVPVLAIAVWGGLRRRR